jgi:hypothetical protein
VPRARAQPDKPHEERSTTQNTHKDEADHLHKTYLKLKDPAPCPRLKANHKDTHIASSFKLRKHLTRSKGKIKHKRCASEKETHPASTIINGEGTWKLP